MKHEIIISTVIAIFLIWEPIQIGKSQMDSTSRERKLKELQKQNDESKSDILQLANSIPDKPKIIVQKKIIPVPVIVPKVVYIRVLEEAPNPKKKYSSEYIPINREKFKLMGLDSIRNIPKVPLPKKPGFFYRLFHKRKLLKKQ